MRSLFLTLVLIVPAVCAELRPQTVKEFEAYMSQADAEMARRALGKPSFLWADASPTRLKRVKAGGLEVATWNKEATRDVTDGLIHDWVGSAFVPGATAEQAHAVLTDFASHASIYAPDVLAARLISTGANGSRSSMKLYKKKVITAVLNAEFLTLYTKLNGARYQGVVRSTRIAEVKNYGETQETERPAGEGLGFLWRLNSYWHIEQRDGGVYLEMRSISLTRGIPFGLSFIVKPMITDLPKESLVSTLEKTRKAILDRQAGASQAPAAR